VVNVEKNYCVVIGCVPDLFVVISQHSSSNLSMSFSRLLFQKCFYNNWCCVGMKTTREDIPSVEKEVVQAAENLAAVELADQGQFGDQQASAAAENVEEGEIAASGGRSGSSSHQQKPEGEGDAPSSVGTVAAANVQPEKAPVIKKGEKGITLVQNDILMLNSSDGKQLYLCGFLFSAPLNTNFVRLRLKKDRGIHEYRVDFVPELDNQRHRKRALAQFTEQLGEARMFDGHMLFLPFEISEKVIIISLETSEFFMGNC